MSSFSKLPKVEEPNIFIAVPLAKNTLIHAETAAYCSVLNQHPSVKWGFVHGMTPEFSRNCLIEHHFHSDPCWTHMLFVDSDVVPPYDALVKFLYLNADFATGFVPLVVDRLPVWNVKHWEEDRWIRMDEKLPEEPFVTESCGGGMMLVRREALVDIGFPWFHAEFQEIFKNEGKGIKTGEDVWFCQRAIACGYKIVAHPKIECEHYNQVGLLKHYNMIERMLVGEVSDEEE